MEFITEEKATELALTSEQIAGLKTEYETHIATEKQVWDRKANDDAELIISGAIESTAKKFNVELPRNAGEKNADYLARLNEKVVYVQQEAVSALEKDYKQKLKDFNGGDATKAELEKAKLDLDAAQIKLANYDDLNEKAGKYDATVTENLTLKENFALTSVKPSCPETVNKYEFDAKWNEFVSVLKEKNNIEVIDNEGWAIDKENPHSKKKISDLIAADTNLTALLQGRTQRGSGTVPGTKIEGVNFEVPANATSEDVSKLINAELDKQGIPKSDKKRSIAFKEMHDRITAKKA